MFFYTLMGVSVMLRREFFQARYRCYLVSPLSVRAYCNTLSSTTAYKPPCGIIAILAHIAIGSVAPLLIHHRAESLLYLHQALRTSGIERYTHLRHGAHTERYAHPKAAMAASASKTVCASFSSKSLWN